MIHLKPYELMVMLAGIISAVFFFVSFRWKSKILIILFCVTIVCFLFLIFFFRNPHRGIVLNKDVILAPCDGKVINIEQIDNDRVQIYIFLSIFNVHRFRNPVSGDVINIEYKKGKFHKAYKKEASKENEANKITFKMKDGSIVYVTQVAGYIARRIACDLKKGDIAKQGDLFGMIYFGSGCLLDIPSKYSLNVDLKSNVKAGETIIAKIDKTYK